MGGGGGGERVRGSTKPRGGRRGVDGTVGQPCGTHSVGRTQRGSCSHLSPWDCVLGTHPACLRYGVAGDLADPETAGLTPHPLGCLCSSAADHIPAFVLGKGSSARVAASVPLPEAGGGAASPVAHRSFCPGPLWGRTPEARAWRGLQADQAKLSPGSILSLSVHALNKFARVPVVSTQFLSSK